MTPMLVLIFDVAPAAAVGTDLWLAGITRVAGAALLQSRRRVDWEGVRRLWTGSLPASVVTLVWLDYSGVGQAPSSRHGSYGAPEG